MSVLATPANMRAYARPPRQIGPLLVQEKQPFAYSPDTDERYSASAGDYWDRPDNEPLLDSGGNEMYLMFEVCRLVHADEDE